MEGSAVKPIPALVEAGAQNVALDGTVHWVTATPSSILSGYFNSLFRNGFFSKLFELSGPSSASTTLFDVHECSWLTAGRICSSMWAQNLVKSLDLHDPFVTNHGNAIGRFTCWNQYRQDRFFNNGARIDYALVDRRLKVLPLKKLYGCVCDSASGCIGGRCAINAVTSFGRYKAAMDGEKGISESTREAIDSLLECVGTGIISTREFSALVGA